MKVWVVTTGEVNYDRSIVAITFTKDKALKHVPMNLPQSRDGKHTPKTWWKNDCDYIAVEEQELECTIEDLVNAVEERKVEAYMQNNITEARIKTLVETLDCSRNKAISILQESAK